LEIEQQRPTLSATEPKLAATVVFVGHARLPQSLAPRDSSPVVSVELETDITSGEIVSVGANAVPHLGAKLLASVLVGHNINESPASLVEEIRRRYVCPSQKAMSTAVVNAFEAYERYRQAGLQSDTARQHGEERRCQGPDDVLRGESAVEKDHPHLARELKGIADLLGESARERRRMGEEMLLLRGSHWYWSRQNGAGEKGVRFG
jgi:hypothetical protein